MFRVDPETVVDATLRGSLARYINHSCAPNCATQIETRGPEKRIFIYTRRLIEAGEELNYDYNFAVEAGGARLPCHCGAATCRKFMN